MSDLGTVDPPPLSAIFDPDNFESPGKLLDYSNVCLSDNACPFPPVSVCSPSTPFHNMETPETEAGLYEGGIGSSMMLPRFPMSGHHQDHEDFFGPAGSVMMLQPSTFSFGPVSSTIFNDEIISPQPIYHHQFFDSICRMDDDDHFRHHHQHQPMSNGHQQHQESEGSNEMANGQQQANCSPSNCPTDFHCQPEMLQGFSFIHPTEQVADLLNIDSDMCAREQQHQQHFLPPLLQPQTPGSEQGNIMTYQTHQGNMIDAASSSSSSPWTNNIQEDSEVKNKTWHSRGVQSFEEPSENAFPSPKPGESSTSEDNNEFNVKPNQDNQGIEALRSHCNQNRPIVAVKGSIRNNVMCKEELQVPRPTRETRRMAARSRVKSSARIQQMRQQQEENLDTNRLHLPLTEEMLRNWKVQDLNRQLKGLPKEERIKVKKERRTLKNRVYAQHSRQKKNSELKECKEELSRSKELNRALEGDMKNFLNKYQCCLLKLAETWGKFQIETDNSELTKRIAKETGLAEVMAEVCADAQRLRRIPEIKFSTSIN